MAENTTDFIPCMLIPLRHYFLLLPNSTIAEVIPMPQLTTMPDKPDSWLGECTWHDRLLPVINIEALIKSKDIDISGANKLCVLHGINDSSDLPVYALPCYGVPQLIHLNESTLLMAEDSEESDFLLFQLPIGNKLAYIPNLDSIEISLSH
ncbi:chemotaxis protein CheW [Pseudomonadota bacterium]|nr:chemotaxis protein CheW [Pseudomonadota bacterium]